VIVTGASGNLGRAVSQAFHQAEARLELVDRSADRLPSLDARPASEGHRLAQAVDVSAPASARGMVEEVVGRFGHIDVPVNTVGGYQAGTLVHETPLDVWDRMMSLNARTAFIVSQAVVPQMLRQGSGKIINIAGETRVGGSGQRCGLQRLEIGRHPSYGKSIGRAAPLRHQCQLRPPWHPRHTAKPISHAKRGSWPLGRA